MSGTHVAILAERGVAAVSGADRVTFLQGLVTNDVARVAADRTVYACLLTPQGRFLHDFVIACAGDTLLIDAEASRVEDLIWRLRPFRLRSKVDLSDARADWTVAAIWGEGACDAFGLPDAPGAARTFAGGVATVDPRLAGLGVRAILPAAGAAAALASLPLVPAGPGDYDRHRLALGIPDGSRDLVPEKALLLENGIDALNGISWDKGCYMGQELTARTRYRGLVKKRLVSVAIDGPAPPPGAVLTADGKEAGEMRSSLGDVGLALVRNDALSGPLAAQGAVLVPHPQAWAPAGDRNADPGDGHVAAIDRSPSR